MSKEETLPAVTESTPSQMGAPVPDGWEQPKPWPVRRYADLRLAVLFLNGERCQRCGKEGGCCAMVDTSGERCPGNLLIFCYACIGARRTWTTEDIEHYRKLALQSAPMLCRMTGWGLPRPQRKKAQPKKPKRTAGRPSKAPEEQHSVLVAFRIKCAQRDAITRGNPAFDLNAYARNRTLARREGNTIAKKRLNEAGVSLLQAMETLDELAKSYQGVSPDHPFVRAVSDEVMRLRTVHGALLEIFFDL